jgi:predicted Zn-dependent peptidase
MVLTHYNKTVLPNGLIIVSEKIPTVRSVSVGVWIKTGSRQESIEVNGLAHYLEHMLFKGTERRNAREIARSLESVGGYLNAFTGKEQTCFYAEILDDQLTRAINILSDMICHSILAPKEIEREREIIFDEIHSIEDTPDDLVQDIFIEKLYPDHALGYPILGAKQTVNYIRREHLINFHRNHYTTDNIVVAAAGNLNHQRLVDLCELKFQLPDTHISMNNTSPQKLGYGEFILERSVNQTHICVGTAALPYNHHRKFELLILNTILGAGMGSRLFQNIREKYGIAYSIYSYVDFFADNGLLAIYLGTEKNKRDKALILLERELNNLKKKPISQNELKRVKAQLKGNLILGLENSSKRMSRLAKMEIYLQNFYDIGHIIHEIDLVTQDGVFDLSHQLFNTERMLQVAFLPN